MVELLQRKLSIQQLQKSTRAPWQCLFPAADSVCVAAESRWFSVVAPTQTSAAPAGDGARLSGHTPQSKFKNTGFSKYHGYERNVFLQFTKGIVLGVLP